MRSSLVYSGDKFAMYLQPFCQFNLAVFKPDIMGSRFVLTEIQIYGTVCKLRGRKLRLKSCFSSNQMLTVNWCWRLHSV